MNLKSIVNALEPVEIQGTTEQEVIGVEIDSRNITSDTLFVAIIGEKLNGHDFIEQAIEKGSNAIVHQEDIKNKKEHVTYIKVRDTKEALADIAATFYQHPSQDFSLIGVTGTNGKTTTTTLIHEMLTRLHKKVGLIGTIENKIGEKVIESHNTTPLSHELQALFSQMKQEEVTHVAMEVSSHALEMKRTLHAAFDIAIFTNLTQDHLDYHGTMEHYKNSKMKLFTGLPEEKTAIINIDDPYAGDFITATKANVLTYGIHEQADLRAENIGITPKGMTFDVVFKEKRLTFETKLIGLFNVYNILAVSGALLTLGYSLEAIKQVVSYVKTVPGRMETVENDFDITVIVDYAHTPDALENVLKTINAFSKGNVISLVGCGGDRDKTKRPLMAAIAEKNSDIAILTSDNPRTENPEEILQDMLTGIAEKENVNVIVDRKEAIEYAATLAKKGDIILIAGKGHEEYQIIGETKYDFSDKQIARDVLVTK